MQFWKVGEVAITCLTETLKELPADEILMDVPTDEVIAKPSWGNSAYLSDSRELRIAIQAMLVEVRGVRIVIDSCFGNDRVSRGSLKTDFLGRASALGFTRESVNFVLCTHLHVDHVGWNTMMVDGRWVPTFSNASYLFARQEFEFWQTNVHPFIELQDTVQPIVEAGLHYLFEPGHKVTDEVRIMATPGHTPGHVSVEISSDGSKALISGDIVHHPLQVHNPGWSSRPDWDPQLARVTRTSVLRRLANSPTLFIGTHFAEPTAGYIKSTSDGDLIFSRER